MRWMDETGDVLLGEGVGYKFLGQKNCISALRVKRQDDHNRRYTCQFVNNNRVETQADYTPVFTDPQTTDLKPLQTYIIVGTVVGGVALLVVIAAVLIKYRRRDKVTEGVQKSGPKSQHQDEPENNMTYVSVNHAHQQASPNMRVKQEEQVTYSTVRAPGRTEADNDPNNLYSNVQIRK
ncbi:uncharacterized protein [Pempheris klunzingeri]|uniref:uncharacterized protein isoform X2 n=1 Tax=Pempheris klunzingeri TaxID=3127111 RepID=UPI00397FD0C6